MAQWELKLIKELEFIMRFNVSKLCNIISDINTEGRQKWINTVKEEINGACVLLVEEASFFVAIQHLRVTYTDQCKQLQIEILPYNSEKLTLYEEKKFLETQVKENETKIIERHTKLKELNSKQIALCKLVEKIPVLFVKEETPTEKELQYLATEVQKLNKEHETVIDQFYEIRQKISNLRKDYDFKMPTEITDIIASVENQSLCINKEIVQSLKAYYEELQRRQDTEESEGLESLRYVINELYNSCHMEENERKFQENIQQVSLDVVQAEISMLRKYWEDNKKHFSLLTKYKQQWKDLTEFVQDLQKTINDNAIERVMNLCKQLCKVEGQLINSTIEYEQKNKKSFTSFGKTIPDVIANFHSTCGKFMVNERNIPRRLTDIITGYNLEIVNLSTNIINSNKSVPKRGAADRRNKNKNKLLNLNKTGFPKRGRGRSKGTKKTNLNAVESKQMTIQTRKSSAIIPKRSTSIRNRRNQKKITTDNVPTSSTSAEGLVTYSNDLHKDINISMENEVEGNNLANSPTWSM